jgi:pimeloyl-ACP methyl ester carboxylesterase
MNRGAANFRAQAAGRRHGAWLRFGLALLLVLPGCLRLDSFLFDQTRVTEYLNPADMDSSWHVRWIIPDSLIEPVTLHGLNSNRVYGFFVRRPAGSGGPLDDVTVIYNHGRSYNINRYWGRVELLWEAGCNVFIYDYEGYGMSDGSPSGEACYADADTALEYVLSRPDVVDSMVVSYGWSLGSFMACHLAADMAGYKPRCLILENPMASASGIAKEGAVLAIPGSFLVDADFDNERRIRSTECPVLLIYGDHDETAVPERNAKVLIAAAEGWTDLTVRVVPGSNHSDLPETMGYDEYERVVKAFIAADSL